MTKPKTPPPAALNIQSSLEAKKLLLYIKAFVESWWFWFWTAELIEELPGASRGPLRFRLMLLARTLVEVTLELQPLDSDSLVTNATLEASNVVASGSWRQAALGNFLSRLGRNIKHHDENALITEG